MTERDPEGLAPEDGLTDDDEDAPDWDGDAEPRDDYSPAEAEDSEKSGEGEV